MTSENNSLETPNNENHQNAEGARTPEPLQTYEQMNIDAPVVSAEAIEERLNRKRAESASEGEKRERGEHEERRGPRGRSDRREKSEKPVEMEPALPSGKVPVPNLREKSDDLEAELNELFQDAPIGDIMAQANAVAGQEILEESEKVKCKVVSIQKDFAFVDVGARDQGMIPLKQFGEEPIEVGQVIDGVVTRYNKEDGLYEISLPLAAAEVGDWSSVSKGMVVEAHLTGINKGGLECEVGKLRGFMPLGQIATFRVENPEQFVGETWKCLITEVNPERRNLVVSRRALMEKENEERREKLMAELKVGQVREGLVRKLIDIGAFVDLGGVDGFIHVSAISWGRVDKPSDVLKEGERIRVTVTKIDRDRNRISLSFKDESCFFFSSKIDLRIQSEVQER